ncbi:hypothetical protein GCM10010218_53310 [Streptomyces mashuensis]|uniref:Uncharacterized protein n=1 Tax=Streptomyces mashuensis TaxID=33904 RepID=A0A919EFE9_9ACTN|nr:hypothetical protein [Streptomyces mashuensis]GHF65180.1 hypothetical protein GCM10010218_53310 [Streptomyces mashuensis]
MTGSVDHRRIGEVMAGGGEAAELFGAAVAALGEVASGDGALRAVRHPLGFLCLPVRREGVHGVCVHVFDDGAHRAATGLTTSPVHAHSWDLASCVLYGEVGNLRVRVRDRPDDPSHRVFEVHSGPGSVDEIRPTARLVRWEPAERETSGPGRIYTLPAGEFHATVVPPGVHAATLLYGRLLPGRFDMTLGPVHGALHRVVRQTCDAAQTVRAARDVLRRLDGRPTR